MASDADRPRSPAECRGRGQYGSSKGQRSLASTRVNSSAAGRGAGTDDVRHIPTVDGTASSASSSPVFSFYTGAGFEVSSGAARDWFGEHLIDRPTG